MTSPSAAPVGEGPEDAGERAETAAPDGVRGADY